MNKKAIKVVELSDMTNNAFAEYVPQYDRKNLLRGIREKNLSEKYIFKCNFPIKDLDFRGMIIEYLEDRGHERHQLYTLSVLDEVVSGAYIAIASRSDVPKNLMAEKRRPYMKT